MVTFVPPVSPLFVPGTRPERFAKADASGADAVILDLEDAVAPAQKDNARDLVLAHADTLARPVIVRVNGIGTAWHKADVEAVRRLKRRCIIMLPKAERTEDLAGLAERLGPRAAVIALVESAAGLGHLPGILSAPGVAVVAFGSVDFALDVGCAHERGALLAARSEIVWRSRLAGLPAPIDGVTTDLASREAAEDDAREARKLGFGGKLAIHPDQIAGIRRGLRPSEAEAAWARRVLAGSAEGAAERIGGEMIDRPLLERARRILAQAGEDAS